METLMPRHFRAVIKRTILPLDSGDAWDFFSQQLGESQGSADLLQTCCSHAPPAPWSLQQAGFAACRKLLAPCRGDDEDWHFYPIFLGPNDFLRAREQQQSRQQVSASGQPQSTVFWQGNASPVRTAP